MTLILHVVGSGIGREIAFTLASHGVKNLICADINLEAGKETAEMVRLDQIKSSEDCKVHALKVDTRNEKSVENLANEAKNIFGRIDYFLSSAGVS